MRTVNIAVLKNQLSKYLTYAKAGETITIRDRNTAVAQIIPFPHNDGISDEERELVADGIIRMPEKPWDISSSTISRCRRSRATLSLRPFSMRGRRDVEQQNLRLLGFQRTQSVTCERANQSVGASDGYSIYSCRLVGYTGGDS